jgi:hypothetical protein
MFKIAITAQVLALQVKILNYSALSGLIVKSAIYQNFIIKLTYKKAASQLIERRQIE